MHCRMRGSWRGLIFTAVLRPYHLFSRSYATLPHRVVTCMLHISLLNYPRLIKPINIVHRLITHMASFIMSYLIRFARLVKFLPSLFIIHILNTFSYLLQVKKHISLSGTSCRSLQSRYMESFLQTPTI